MEAIRVDWTDDRLDALSSRMDERFDRVDERFKQVDERFSRIETDMREMRAAMGARFDSLQRMILLWAISVIVALVGLGIS